jgi:hypothetical protein
MILALNKHAALHIFTSPEDAARYLEAIDVQQDAFEFCDTRGQKFIPVYTRVPQASPSGLFHTVDIGQFKLETHDDIDPTLPESFIRRARHIEYSSIPTVTSIESLRDEIRKQT